MSQPDQWGKVLVIRPGALGDVCLAIPFVRSLERYFEVHWLIRPQYASLPQCLGLNTALIPLEKGREQAILPLLQQVGYDVVLDLSHWPEVAQLVQQLDCIPIRGITYDPDQDERIQINRQGVDLYDPYNCLVPIIDPMHQTERWRCLVHGTIGLDVPIEWQLPSLLPPGNKLRIFIHPHAGKVSKLWPVRNYVQVLAKLAARQPIECLINAGNRQEWLRSLELCGRLWARGIPARLVPKDRTFARLCNTLQNVHLALGNDSGPMHLASLLGTPNVVIFGPYSPWEFGPLWRSVPVTPSFEGASTDTVMVEAVAVALADALDSYHPRQRYRAAA